MNTPKSQNPEGKVRGGRPMTMRECMDAEDGGQLIPEGSVASICLVTDWRLPHFASAEIQLFSGYEPKIGDMLILATTLAAMQRRLEALQKFAQDVMECWPEGAPDGGELQACAERNGLLIRVLMPEPCGEHCNCREFLYEDDWPTTCYRKTTLLTGKPESDERIAILRDGKGDGVSTAEGEGNE